MRLHIRIRSNNTIIPFDHQKMLTGVIHKWIGQNDEHGKLSLYSFSQLRDLKATQKGLQTGAVSSFFISAYDSSLIHRIIKGIREDNTMFNGLEVEEVQLQDDPCFDVRDYFFAASPIFIKKKTEKGMKHFTYLDKECCDLLKQTLLHKMSKVGLEDETLEISFDLNYAGATTKLINYNGIKNRANVCPVFIHGKPETKLFAWNVGLGHSTGIGFGAIS